MSLFILFTCRSQSDLYLLSFSFNWFYFQLFHYFFFPVVVKRIVPGCSSEKFHLDLRKSFFFPPLRVQISLPYKIMRKASALYTFVLEYF